MPTTVSTVPTKNRTPDVVDTLARIASLRTLLMDTCQAFMGRIDARICYLIKMMEGQDEFPSSGKKCLNSVEQAFEGLKLKPYKGRRRDLKRLERLVEEMEEILGV